MEYKNLISVIVTTYNQETTISRTLDSILMQRCHVPFEIIIGEDGSTDGTRRICIEYEKKHPNIVRLMPIAPNKGVIDNYHDCLLAAHGRYIADCAGDDFWVDELKLEKEVNILEAHNDVTLVHTAWQRYYESNGITERNTTEPFKEGITDGKQMLEAIVTQITAPVIHLCTAMYRADVLRREYEKDTFLFRNHEFGCEDLQICFIMANSGKIAYISDVTLSYSYGKQSVSYSSNDGKQLVFVRRTTSLSHYLCEKYALKSNNIESFFKKKLFAISMHSFRSHNKKLINTARDCANSWGVTMPTKAKILCFIMKSETLWSMALNLRKALVGRNTNNLA